jgi:hypothetical protein
MAQRRYTKLELDYLYRRAKQGATTNKNMGVPPDEEGLSLGELDIVVDELRQATDSLYQQDLIHIINYSGWVDPMKYKEVLEPFLNEPYRARTVLEILCDDWDLVSLYKDKLREFVRGVSWPSSFGDPAEDCRSTALSLIDWKWRKLNDPTLLREVIALHRREVPGTRAHEAAYQTLWNLLGGPYVSEEETIRLAERLAAELEDAIASGRDNLRAISETFVHAANPERTANDLLAALSHENETVRFAAARRLGCLRDESTFGALTEVLLDKSGKSDFRVEVLRAVERFGTKGTNFLITIMADQTEDEWVRRDAVRALGKIGDVRAVTPLMDMLTATAAQNESNPDEDATFLLRSWVVEALGKLGDVQLAQRLQRDLLDCHDPIVPDGAGDHTRGDR